MKSLIKYFVILSFFSIYNFYSYAVGSEDPAYNFIMSFAPNTILAGECLEVRTYSSNFPATKTINIQFPHQGDLHFYSDKGCTQEVTNTGIQLNASDHFYVRSQSLVKPTDNPNYIYYPYITVIAFDAKTSYYSTSSLQINPDPAYSTTLDMTDSIREEITGIKSDGTVTAGSCVPGRFIDTQSFLAPYTPIISLTTSDANDITFYSSSTCNSGSEIDAAHPLTSISSPYYVQTKSGTFKPYTIGATIDGINAPSISFTTAPPPPANVELISSTKNAFDGECVSVQAKFTEITLDHPASILVTGSNVSFFKDSNCSTSSDGTISINPGNNSTTIYTLINQGVGQSITLTAQAASPFLILNPNNLPIVTIKDDHKFSAQLTSNAIKHLKEDQKTFCTSSADCPTLTNLTTTIANNQCAKMQLISSENIPFEIVISDQSPNNAHIYKTFADCIDDLNPKDAPSATRLLSVVINPGQYIWIGNLTPQNFSVNITPITNQTYIDFSKTKTKLKPDKLNHFSATNSLTSTYLFRSISVLDFGGMYSQPLIDIYGTTAPPAIANEASKYYDGLTYTDLSCPFDATHPYTAQEVLSTDNPNSPTAGNKNLSPMYICVRIPTSFEKSLFSFKGIFTTYAPKEQTDVSTQNQDQFNVFFNNFSVLTHAESFGFPSTMCTDSYSKLECLFFTLEYAYGGVTPGQTKFSSDGKFSSRTQSIYDDGQFYYFGGMFETLGGSMASTSGPDNIPAGASIISPNIEPTSGGQCGLDMNNNLIFPIFSTSGTTANNLISLYVCSAGGWGDPKDPHWIDPTNTTIHHAPNEWKNLGTFTSILPLFQGSQN